MSDGNGTKIQVVYVHPDELKPADYNPRDATDKEFSDLRKSIERFGLIDPIIVNSAENRKNVVIGGHFRLRVAKDLGLTEVPVVYREIPDLKTEQEINLRLNNNTGHNDIALLAKIEEELLIDVGFTASQINDIFPLPEPTPSPDAAPAAREECPVKEGDLYLLGEHRLLCGSATRPEDVARVMGEDKADMVFTDPPYNVDYSGRGEQTSEKIDNDNLPEETFELFIRTAFANMRGVMNEGAVYYICSGWSSYPVFHKVLLELGLYRSGVIIWKKNVASMGWNDYRYKHEWIVTGKRKKLDKGVSILYGWRQGKHFFRDARDEYDVWEVPRDDVLNYVHPTQKPVYLVEKALANSSLRHGIILDMFGVSGSTLIASERLTRKCRMIEQDPKYVDVIIRRWETLTGRKAQKA